MDKIDYNPIEIARIHMGEDVFPVADTYLQLSLAISMESIAKNLAVIVAALKSGELAKQIAPTSFTTTNTCPHGAIPSQCDICSGRIKTTAGPWETK